MANIKDIDLVVHHNVEDLFTVVGASEENIERLDSAPYSYWKETFKQLLKRPLAIVSIVVVILLVLFTIFGPMVHSFNVDLSKPNVDRFEEYLPPNIVNWFGTGGAKMINFKKLDLWTCVWKGSQLSLIIGVVVALIDTSLGIFIGALWGYFRRLDPIMIEIRNFVNNVPGLLLYFLLMQILNPQTTMEYFWTLIFVLTMFGWLGLASFIRNQIIIIRNREYNVASQTLGTSSKNMITHNLLPYLISVIVTDVSTAIPAAISSEVGLAFFGLSFNAAKGDITLGQLLTEATQDDWMTPSHFYLLLVPMIVLVPLTVSFFYLGLVLSDVTDPKNHR